MGDKSYNEGIVKFATGIRKRNQGMIDDYAKRQDRQQLYATIGNAVGGLGNAFAQRHALQQQQQASAQIGAMPELGLSPEVAGQIPPQELLRTAIALRTSGRLTPLQQAQLEEIEYARGLRGTTEERAAEKYAAELEATNAQTAAALALARERERLPPRIPVTVGADGRPVVAQGSYEVDPNDAFRIASGGGGTAGDRMMRITVREGDAYNRAGLPVGEQEIPQSSFTAGINQSSLSSRATEGYAQKRSMADVVAGRLDARQKQELLVSLVKERASLRAGQVAAQGRLAGSAMSASDLNYGTPGNTMQDIYGQAGALVGDGDTSDLDAMIEALRAGGAGAPGLIQPPSYEGLPQSAPVAPQGAQATETATGANGEKYELVNGSWVQVK